MIKRILTNILLSALAIYLVSLVLDSMTITSITSLFTLSIVLGVLNVTIKPILKFFSFPITLLTLGLFSFVVNAFVLKIGFSLVSGAYLYGFIPAIWASILISFCNWVLEKIFK